LIKLDYLELLQQVVPVPQQDLAGAVVGQHEAAKKVTAAAARAILAIFISNVCFV